MPVTANLNPVNQIGQYNEKHLARNLFLVKVTYCEFWDRKQLLGIVKHEFPVSIQKYSKQKHTAVALLCGNLLLNGRYNEKEAYTYI